VTPTRRATDHAASVRARLAKLSRERSVELQLLLSEFAIERLLYRLGVSRHAESYVLKGALLFKLWSSGRGRATWDLDLLGHGADSVADVVALVRDLCEIGAEDGIVFDSDSVRGEEIRTADEYAGVRVRLEARLAGARIPMQVDVGFGDAITPPPVRQRYPTLLDHPPPNIFVYPREAVVAEKLEAMVSLGVTNSRMKDFYDVHLLASSFPFQGGPLSRAIRATFERRSTPLPGTLPLVLKRDFLSAPERQIQWRAFLRRGRLDAEPDAGALADALAAFLGAPLQALALGEPFETEWPAGGPWNRGIDTA
jgi:predicted nucleotidyltransferase component of viral defense system